MADTRELIIRLKQVRVEKNLTFAKIMQLVEANGDFVSKGTLSKLFAEGSENENFRFSTTIQPVANVLLNIDRIEDNDELDVKAYKELLKYKNERIKDLEAQLDKEKVKYHEKLDKERARHQASIDFLKGQIELKDKRMDFLFDEVAKKDALLLENYKRDKE